MANFPIARKYTGSLLPVQPPCRITPTAHGITPLLRTLPTLGYEARTISNQAPGKRQQGSITDKSSEETHQRNHNVMRAKAVLTCKTRLKAPGLGLVMHVDSCPKCHEAGYLVREYRRIRGKRYGPYLVVNHYISKSQSGHTRIRRCYISLKKLAPNEKARICNLLAVSRVSARGRIVNYQPF